MTFRTRHAMPLTCSIGWTARNMFTATPVAAEGHGACGDIRKKMVGQMLFDD